MSLTLDHLAAAMAAADGKMPEVILRAFLPQSETVFGRQLVPLTAGHHLVLQHLDHPLVRPGQAWQANDVPVAMFVFTRPSRESFSLIQCDAFEAALFEFLDTLPCEEMGHAIHALVGHWMGASASALPMESPIPAQKKTAVSAGG